MLSDGNIYYVLITIVACREGSMGEIPHSTLSDGNDHDKVSDNIMYFVFSIFIVQKQKFLFVYPCLNLEMYFVCSIATYWVEFKKKSYLCECYGIGPTLHMPKYTS